MTIDNVSDTARWVAVYRADENDRPDRLFSDPYARRLAGEKGAAIDASLPDRRAISKAIVVRTVSIDTLLQHCLAQGADAVVNLAAGLDSRPWRMKLPPSLHWYDVDLPGILDYKVDLLRDERTSCHYEPVRTDLTDRAATGALLARIGAQHQKIVAITEGLLVYLTREQVAALGTAMAAVPSFRWWIGDLASPLLMRYIERSHGPALRNAPMQFAPPEGTKFFEPLGWREAAFKSTLVEARRLGRPLPRDWIGRIISFFMPAAKVEQYRRMSGVVLYTRHEG